MVSETLKSSLTSVLDSKNNAEGFAVLLYETEVDVLSSTNVVRMCCLRVIDFSIFGANNL
jgi:hypothetical protein